MVKLGWSTEILKSNGLKGGLGPGVASGAVLSNGLVKIKAPAKAESIKIESKPIDPARAPIVNLFKPEKRLTHEQIAERAKLIWEKRGCIPGEDELNWKEAESQLRKELGID